MPKVSKEDIKEKNVSFKTALDLTVTINKFSIFQKKKVSFCMNVQNYPSTFCHSSPVK